MVKTFTERVYVIPLRKEFLKAPVWKRAKRSVVAVRKFVEKHTRSEKILIGDELNKELWSYGAKNPPARVKVFVRKMEDDVVFVNSFGAAKRVPKKKEEKKEEIKKLEEMAKEAGKEEKKEKERVPRKTDEKKSKIKKK